jgi:hypothetical protein
MDYKDKYIATLERQIELLKNSFILQQDKINSLERSIASPMNGIASPMNGQNLKETGTNPMEITIPIISPITTGNDTKPKKATTKRTLDPSLGPACNGKRILLIIGCRIRKRKCDRIKPSCTYCTKLYKSDQSEGCVYPERKGKARKVMIETPAPSESE